MFVGRTRRPVSRWEGLPPIDGGNGGLSPAIALRCWKIIRIGGHKKLAISAAVGKLRGMRVAYKMAARPAFVFLLTPW